MRRQCGRGVFKKLTISAIEERPFGRFWSPETKTLSPCNSCSPVTLEAIAFGRSGLEKCRVSHQIHHTQVVRTRLDFDDRLAFPDMTAGIRGDDNLE
jgi:hypothetical protein